MFDFRRFVSVRRGFSRFLLSISVRRLSLPFYACPVLSVGLLVVLCCHRAALVILRRIVHRLRSVSSVLCWPPVLEASGGFHSHLSMDIFILSMILSASISIFAISMLSSCNFVSALLASSRSASSTLHCVLTSLSFAVNSSYVNYSPFPISVQRPALRSVILPLSGLRRMLHWFRSASGDSRCFLRVLRCRSCCAASMPF